MDTFMQKCTSLFRVVGCLRQTSNVLHYSNNRGSCRMSSAMRFFPLFLSHFITVK